VSAPADIISPKRSITRPASAAAVWLKKYFIKLYVALDKTQRERAAEIIHRYEYLTSKRDELPGKKMAFLAMEPGYELISFGLSVPRIIKAAAQSHK